MDLGLKGLCVTLLRKWEAPPRMEFPLLSLLQRPIQKPEPEIRQSDYSLLLVHKTSPMKLHALLQGKKEVNKPS